MPAPLLWLGAGALALFAGAKYSNQEKLRKSVNLLPGEGNKYVEPVNGAIVSCGVFGVFDHTGIWVDGHIVELQGNGLIRGVSTNRFLQGRSGEQIYIACDTQLTPLVDCNAAERASQKLFQYSEYDLIKNNCHKFVWHCISGKNQVVTRFSELNKYISDKFSTDISWQKMQIEL